MRFLIAGSSGLIGSALADSLIGEGHEVVRLVRPDTNADGIPWDPPNPLAPHMVEGFDGVANFGGRSIGERRWSDREKRLLWDSRVGPTRVLAEALAATTARPAVLVNGSAIGFFGDGGDRVLTDDAPKGEGFLTDLTAAWEAATAPASAVGIRVVTPRSGIVLSPDGGALGRLLAPFGPRWLSPYRWGLGGPVAGGKMYWSWISLRDEVAGIRHLLVDSQLAGPVNLVSPQPVTNRVFIKTLGRVIRRPTVMPIPGFVLKVVLGSELADALVLEGQRAVPARLQADGFVFTDTDLELAMREALA
ncbi:MAG: TIGR01777 family oxidoreductase [Acidimicrobiia bacterium]